MQGVSLGRAKCLVTTAPALHGKVAEPEGGGGGGEPTHFFRLQFPPQFFLIIMVIGYRVLSSWT